MDPKALILCVDDEPVNLVIMEELLQDSYELLSAKSGEGCLQQVNLQTPDLILLDLNMPKKNGREVLQEIRSDEKLSRIPVVVLTTSEQEADILRSYDLGCNSYIHKPVDVDQFTEVVRRLGSYWFDVVTLPSSTTSA